MKNQLFFILALALCASQSQVKALMPATVVNGQVERANVGLMQNEAAAVLNKFYKQNNLQNVQLTQDLNEEAVKNLISNAPGNNTLAVYLSSKNNGQTYSPYLFKKDERAGLDKKVLVALDQDFKALAEANNHYQLHRNSGTRAIGKLVAVYRNPEYVVNSATKNGNQLYLVEVRYVQ